MKKLGIALGVLAFLLGVFHDELGTELTVLLASVFPVSIVVYAVATRKRSPEKEQDSVDKLWRNTREELERLQPSNPTIPFFEILFRNGRKLGADKVMLNCAVMSFVDACMNQGQSRTCVSISLGRNIETSIAEAVFVAFEKREFNKDTIEEAKRRENSFRSSFERIAWRIVRQLSEINEGAFATCSEPFSPQPVPPSRSGNTP